MPSNLGNGGLLKASTAYFNSTINIPIQHTCKYRKDFEIPDGYTCYIWYTYIHSHGQRKCNNGVFINSSLGFSSNWYNYQMGSDGGTTGSGSEPRGQTTINAEVKAWVDSRQIIKIFLKYNKNTSVTIITLLVTITAYMWPCHKFSNDTGLVFWWTTRAHN